MNTTDRTSPATPARTPTGSGAPKGVARKGVLSALRPDRLTGAPGDPTPDRPGIRIYAPPVYRDHEDGARWTKRLGDTPTAAYACPCGRTGTATGPRTVAALIAQYDAHKAACTGAPAALTEARTAA
ncbi:hypothetical protein [Streptomyces chattanoogensis]|uniref:hypothetical protein n=1 Tax=Streptomyces chattanoogensis TaxID=66876 RepID=UPI0036AA31EA